MSNTKARTLELLANEANAAAISAHQNCLPFIELQRESHQYKLLSWQVGGFIKEVRTRPGDTRRCARAFEVADRILTIEDALREMPLPDGQCMRQNNWRQEPFCTCWYNKIVPGWKSTY